MNSRFPYNLSYDPPVPVCSLAVSSSTQARAVELEAVIDTGADATIIPARHLRQIGAQPTFEAHLRSQWGERRLVFLYLVDLRIGGLLLPVRSWLAMIKVTKRFWDGMCSINSTYTSTVRSV